jgi:hypothetical protein
MMLRSTILRPLGLAVGLTLGLAGATGALAHHGWSGYDASKPLTVTGTIKVSGYEHPHGFVRLASTDKEWVVTLAPPSRMENRGLPAAMLKTGTAATVMGYPSRTDPDEMRAEWIQIDGKTTQLR